ncbi:TPA: hypothetical protein N0F65_008853 [Lagenidium giganteum]|uniref:Uncharacterized protein n=1 Tax=Lagenidium giganteum TaxID=4803 RepID=A0AAV2YPB6_9STRA|nr:TPA: hypothetical protein N0F65_008853 [Lagenidium giganteum]
MWTQRLETVVNRAEVLEITHLDEVESAQYLLEETERQKFCAKMCSNDATAAESVDALARSLVALGADHKHAVLKASEIYANRANTMLLIDSLRSCFNEVRKRDLMKMEERRRRHREKQSDKRERIADKFRMKRQVLAERMEQTRILQREKEEAENRAKLRVELEEKRRLEKAERKQWVSFVTKVDMVVVLLVMVVVFSEHLLDHELFRPVCHPDDSQRSMLSWWTTNSFSTFGCHFKYGLKMTGILVGIIAFFFVCAQLQLLNLAIPLAMGMLLYQVRAGWMNMMLRLPLVLVLYGFNQSILYVLNHSERPEVSEGDNVRTTRLVAKAQRKRRWLLLHVLFPVASLVLSGVTSIVIACDAPQECVATGSQALASGWDLVADMLREAYHLKN